MLRDFIDQTRIDDLRLEESRRANAEAQARLAEASANAEAASFEMATTYGPYVVAFVISGIAIAALFIPLALVLRGINALKEVITGIFDLLTFGLFGDDDEEADDEN